MLEFTKPIKHRKKLRNYFITFPQTEKTKEEFGKDLRDIYNVKSTEIAQEEHKDGGKHLHAILKLNSPKNKHYMIEQIKIYYPDDWKRIHICSVRSMPLAQAYIKKEDKQVLQEGPPQRSVREMVQDAKYGPRPEKVFYYDKLYNRYKQMSEF